MAEKRSLWIWGMIAVFAWLILMGPAGPALAQDTIKIGAVIPLSKASFAQAGEEQRRGLLMALEEINKAGGVLGKKVDLIIEDDTGEPSVGIAAAEKLITRDKVDRQDHRRLPRLPESLPELPKIKSLTT
jgi:branched-chain amino acid transport system substrate-binding protein